MMKQKSKIVETNYQITFNPRFNDEKYGITNELVNQLEDLVMEANNPKNKTIIHKLTELILEYPKTPILKNYLSVAYNARGLQAKSIEVNKWILAEHPDYLYAKINLAYYYLFKKDYKKVEEIMGKEMDIKALYPDRDLFHVGEVLCFLKFAIDYFVEIEDMEAADIRLKIMQGLEPEHPITEAAVEIMMAYRLQKNQEKFVRASANSIAVDANRATPETKDKNQPIFNHPIIDELYNNDWEINQSILKDILALPHKTLVEDLEAVLKDAVNRHNYFYEEADEKSYLYFPIHALLLLAEIASEKSLPLVLDTLSYNNEFLDFWFEEFITETLWMVFFKIGKNNLTSLKTFMLTPAINTYTKAAVSTTLLQLFLHQEKTKQELLPFYQDVLQGFHDANLNENLVDEDALAFIIGDIADMDMEELLPIIKKLFEKGYINESIAGTYQEVAKDVVSTYLFQDKQNVLNIFKYYDKITPFFKRNDPGDSFFKDNNNFIDSLQETKTLAAQEESAAPLISNKVGRNDPCPCGSGKKYKKCCME